MDIHRCRFVPYPSSAINTLAFSHNALSANHGKTLPSVRLVIGKANGDIEIWNPLEGRWNQESIIRGGKDRTIEGLVWTQDPVEFDRNGAELPGKLRLFSIGYSTAVTEWDLTSSKPVRSTSGAYSEIWCIAAQPEARSPVRNTQQSDQSFMESSVASFQHLAIGCADGAIVLLSTAEGDLQYLRTLARASKKKARVLSIAWQDHNVVISGHADSMIRIWDARSGRQIRNLSLGAAPVGGPKEILVWAVKCLQDGTIISGDSTGALGIWESKNYTQLQRIQGHVADVLDVVASGDGETIFSCGIDRRTTVYRRKEKDTKGGKRRWAKLSHQRLHKHDVKAMAVFESKTMSIVASGGMNTSNSSVCLS